MAILEQYREGRLLLEERVKVLNSAGCFFYYNTARRAESSDSDDYYLDYASHETTNAYFEPAGWYSEIDKKEFPLVTWKEKVKRKQKVKLKSLEKGDGGLTKILLSDGWAYTFFSQTPLPDNYFQEFRSKALAYKMSHELLERYSAVLKEGPQEESWLLRKIRDFLQ